MLMNSTNQKVNSSVTAGKMCKWMLQAGNKAGVDGLFLFPMITKIHEMH